MPERNAGKIEELDLRGQICPATLLKSLRELTNVQEKWEEGVTRLDILTSNRDSTASVSNAAISMGYDVDVQQVESYYRISVQAGK